MVSTLVNYIKFQCNHNNQIIHFNIMNETYSYFAFTKKLNFNHIINYGDFHQTNYINYYGDFQNHHINNYGDFHFFPGPYQQLLSP